jgi:hypothetical protein
MNKKIKIQNFYNTFLIKNTPYLIIENQKDATSFLDSGIKKKTVIVLIIVIRFTHSLVNKSESITHIGNYNKYCGFS